ncbi:MAG: fumarate hydratase [Thermoplasmata archaeon]|nr:MAG: fumarate hydratase [Thermoplasmata archaeon]RLF34132.1 MAG: fumarate hydratase [Thermoplasmata archaeon]RLF53262.1 MAG: fumarate hydratase [Thermoplasmata archaeon]
MEYHLSLPVSFEDVKKLHVGDIIYVSGRVFTARDEAHHIMLEKNNIPFDPSDMALFHCGPLMRKTKEGWEVVSAGPTTSSRMELFEDKFLEKYNVKIIIGKGGMGKNTQKALQKYISIYASYTGGAGALAADKVEEVEDVYWLDELGMPEAVWVFKVKDFGPLVVAMDSHGNSVYRRRFKK